MAAAGAPLNGAMADSLRAPVAIVGAGPAGMLLSHLLAADGVESVVLETRSEEYVASRIRAGILEQSTVDLLRATGLGERLEREGDPHRGIYLQWPHERHHLDFVDLTGRSVWVYGQTEVQKDLIAARNAAGQEIHYEVSDTELHDLETDQPSVTFTDVDGNARRLVADVVVGCDGSFGPSRAAVPDEVRRTWEKVYPYSWFGILADVAPSTDELIYAWHPDGFALHSMRSSSVSRFYLQVPNDTDADDWSDDRIWDALGHPARPRPGRVAADDRADHRPQRAADALLRADARCGTGGSSSPATPPTSSRRPAPRASTSRSPTSPCSRRPWSTWSARTTTGWPTPTPTPRCDGSGGARTSHGG